MEVSFKDLLCSGRRGRLEMIAATVALSQKPAGVKQLMRHLSLNNRALLKHLEFMITRRLIKETETKKTAEKTAPTYQAKKRVRRFLRTYCDILRLLYGEGFMQNRNNLAVACLKHCAESESP